MEDDPLKYVAALTMTLYLIWMILKNKDIFKK